jgi:hypothetical protein
LKERFEFYRTASETVSEPLEEEEDDEERPLHNEIINNDTTGFFRDLDKYQKFLDQINM